MEKNIIPKEVFIYEVGNKKAERMEDQLVKKGGRKGYITDRHGRSS
jgi:hypothetical protein